LIALIAKARLLRSPIGNRGSNALARKDQFCFKRIRGFERSGSQIHDWLLDDLDERRSTVAGPREP